jgi:hypothetical protein
VTTIGNDLPVVLAGLADLRRFGIDPLTGEACGLGYRILCDVTEAGRKVLARMLGIPDLKVAEAWNRGSTEAPHVGSVMLSMEMFVPLAVFALLENGCKVALLARDGTVFGFSTEPSDATLRIIEVMHHGVGRSFRYAGTAGDRNVHLITGRVE